MTEDKERLERQKIFGENLERIRKQEGFSRKELAEKLCITENSLGAYCNGNRSPSLDKILKLATILGCTVADLIGENSKLKDRDAFRQRVKHAAAIVQAADFAPFIRERENPVILTSLFQDVVRSDDGVELAPETMIQFKNVDEFVKAVEMINLDAVKQNCGFKTALLQRVKKQK